MLWAYKTILFVQHNVTLRFRLSSTPDRTPRACKIFEFVSRLKRNDEREIVYIYTIPTIVERVGRSGNNITRKLIINMIIVLKLSSFSRKSAVFQSMILIHFIKILAFLKYYSKAFNVLTVKRIRLL